jgi:hypothetical protein
MVSRLLAKAPALSATAVSLFTFMAIAFADTADDNWTSFRQAVPAHLQTLALSEPDKTGLRTLIISEPPPDTLPKSQYVLRLRGIFGDHFRTAKILRKETGLHGWVEDIVVGIGGYAGGGNDTELRDDLALLAETLWGTSYKMAPLALPAPRSREVSPEVSDIAIRQSELRDWLLDGKVRLSPVTAPAAPPRALMELAAAGTMGAFLSNDQRGLTVLLIDRRQPFEANRVEFRKFALDTDLVVGAVSIGSDYLAFVGRERQASVTTVPPLRFETALLLVTSKRAELSQSYERTQIFAGQLQSGKFKGWDWAPIYLSPELVDTELGSVLNFTDQMLKSWSEGGIIKYLYFGYPVPAQFPFPHPIMDEVQHIEPKVDSILFNWNTTGAFSLVDYQPTTTKPKSATLSVLHSGSLPMVYRDEERPIFD